MIFQSMPARGFAGFAEFAGPQVAFTTLNELAKELPH